MNKKNVGSSFDDFLKEAGIHEEVTAAALKRVLSRQIEKAMKERRLTKATMARMMETSRPALDRLLDPENDSLTLNTLVRAAGVLGRQLRIELV